MKHVTSYMALLLLLIPTLLNCQECDSIYKSELTCIGTATFYKPSDFQIGKLTFNLPIDSILNRYGHPVRKDTLNGENVKVKTLFYSDIIFVFVEYYDKSGTSLDQVYCCRSDHSMPNGIHCGMSVKDVKRLLGDSYKDRLYQINNQNGTIEITGPNGFPYVTLVFITGILKQIILFTGAG